MAEPTLRVVAHILARADTSAAIKAILETLITPTRQEEGCLRYELLQNKADPADFVFDEEWTSEAMLEQHLASPHLQAALPKLNELVAAPVDIRSYWLVA